MANKMPLYYFHYTHETVVARNAMIAAAFYASHHQIPYYTYMSGDTEVIASIEIPFKVIEICQEPTTSDSEEGTICKVHNGHAVPPGYFDFLMCEALFDTIYDDYDVATNFYDDILMPLKEDFHKLTGAQLQRLATAIVNRRHDHDDILPTLEYIITNHYGMFMEYMDDIIGQRGDWEFQDKLDNLLRPALHTGGSC